MIDRSIELIELNNEDFPAYDNMVLYYRLSAAVLL